MHRKKEGRKKNNQDVLFFCAETYWSGSTN